MSAPEAASEGLPDPELHKAVAYLQKAGDDAVRHNANLEAIGFYGEALGLLEKVRETDERNTRELELQLALGAVLIATQGYGSSRVERAYSRARELNDVVEMIENIGDAGMVAPGDKCADRRDSHHPAGFGHGSYHVVGLAARMR